MCAAIGASDDLVSEHSVQVSFCLGCFSLLFTSLGMAPVWGPSLLYPAVLLTCILLISSLSSSILSSFETKEAEPSSPPSRTSGTALFEGGVKLNDGKKLSPL